MLVSIVFMLAHWKTSSSIILSTVLLFILCYVQFKDKEKVSVEFETTSSDHPCSCPTKINTPFGEHRPVIVPDSMPPIPSDIRDKIQDNRLENDDLIVTVAGYDMRLDLYNWIEFMKAANEHRFLVFCTDSLLYRHLTNAGYESRAVLVPEDWIWFSNSSSYTPWILEQLVHLDINPLMLDVHQLILWPRAREYISTMMHVRWDTQFIVTGRDASHLQGGLIYLMRNSYQVKRLLAQVVQNQIYEPTLSLQEAFHQALEQSHIHVKSGFVLLLDDVHFPNGEAYFEKKHSGTADIDPYMVYVNHEVKTYILTKCRQANIGIV